MKLYPYPGFEDLVKLYATDLSAEEAGAILKPIMEARAKFVFPENISAKEITIPGPDEGQELMLKVLTHKDAPANSPIVIDFHGGGWVAGDPAGDDERNCEIMKEYPCIFVSPDYRLSNDEVHFPAPLEDALAAYKWVLEHGQELGGDPKRIALYGTSAGANIEAGLQLKIRDLGLQQPCVTILNCPALLKGLGTYSKQQFGGIGPSSTPFHKQAEYIYEPITGQPPSYYAFPYYCPDVTGLGPTDFILGEYDPLRSEAVEYACRLLQSGVPTELHVFPGVSHGFCGVIDSPLTKHTVAGIALTLKRWFEA